LKIGFPGVFRFERIIIVPGRLRRAAFAADDFADSRGEKCAIDSGHVAQIDGFFELLLERLGKADDHGVRWAAVAAQQTADGRIRNAAVFGQAHRTHEGITGRMLHKGADAVFNQHEINWQMAARHIVGIGVVLRHGKRLGSERFHHAPDARHSHGGLLTSRQCCLQSVGISES